MSLTTVGLKTSIWNNNIRSIILLALYPFLIMGMVWVVCALTGLARISLENTPGDELARLFVTAGNNALETAWPAVMAVVGVWFLIAWAFHGSMMRMLSQAKPVTRQEEPELYNLLENLCISRGIPIPRLEIIEDPALNAFASGIDKRSYCITVTRGLMQKLKKDELEAVLGHELTHILNRDVRLLVISVIFTGMVGFACQMFWNALRHMRWQSRGGSRNGNGGQMIIILLGIGIVLWIGYMATLFTRMALSRRREYMADAGAVELTRNPEAMMRALQRIAGHDRIKEATDDVALMCTENSAPFLGLFATHPKIGDRIRALSELTGTPVPQIENEEILTENHKDGSDFPVSPWSHKKTP